MLYYVCHSVWEERRKFLPHLVSGSDNLREGHLGRRKKSKEGKIREKEREERRRKRVVITWN